MGGMEGEEVTTGEGGGSDMSAYVAEQLGASRTTPSNVACQATHKCHGVHL